MEHLKTCGELISSPRAVTSIESYRFITFMRTAPSAICRDVITYLKKQLKDPLVFPETKLRALQILHRCVMTANYDFLVIAAHKVLDRLQTFARHKKHTSEERRGEDLFGKASLSSYINRSASAEFLKELLISIKTWAGRFGHGPDGQPTRFLTTYETLLREGVVFPNEMKPENPPDSPVSQKSMIKRSETGKMENADLETIQRSIVSLKDLLASPGSDTKALERAADTLNRQSESLQKLIQTQTEERGSEVHLASFLMANDAIKAVLEEYELKRNRKSSTVSDLVSLDSPNGREASESWSRGRSSIGVRSLGKRTDFNQMETGRTNPIWGSVTGEDEEGRILGLKTEVQKVKKQAEEIAAGNARIMIELGIKANEYEDKIRLFDEKQAQETAEILDLYSRYRKLTSLSSEIDSSISVLTQSISDLKEKNQFLSREILRFSTDLPSPQPYIKPAPYCNVLEFKSTWHQEQGILVDFARVKISFLIAIKENAGRIKLKIANKGTEDWDGLETKLIYQPGEGIEVEINKETEEFSVAPGASIDRVLGMQVTGFFPGVPAMAMTCKHPSDLQIMVFLPMTLFRFLSPTHLATGQVIALWTDFEGSEAMQKFTNLQVGNSVPALVNLFRDMKSLQVFTNAELPILGGKAVLGCAEKDTQVVMIKAKLDASGGRISVRSSSPRLKDCVLSALSLAVINQM